MPPPDCHPSDSLASDSLASDSLASDSQASETQLPDSQRVAWRCADGSPMACDEKRKVLQQNLNEFITVARDLLEDAALMDCDVDQVRDVLSQTVLSLPLRYR